MRGFFEPIVKIGLGVAFGWLVIHTIGPMSDHVLDVLGGAADAPWWMWLFLPIFLLVFLGSIICPPLFLMAVFILPIMRLITGEWRMPNWSEKAWREYFYFLSVYIYLFWALVGNFVVTAPR